MYSLSGRLNYFGYNMFWAFGICALLNHLQTRFGYLVSPTLGSPVELDKADVSFQVRELETFMHDKFLDEEALAFSFDLHVDLNSVISWNTNQIFLSLVCEFEQAQGTSSITVWDQRITRPDSKNHVLALENEYLEYFVTDMTKQLKNKDLKLYLKWEAMSTVGFYYHDMVEVGSYRVPENYNTVGRK